MYYNPNSFPFNEHQYTRDELDMERVKNLLDDELSAHRVAIGVEGAPDANGDRETIYHRGAEIYGPFTFNGTLRSLEENIDNSVYAVSGPRDSLANRLFVGGWYTHALFETDAGEHIAISRTSPYEAFSATADTTGKNGQTFAVLSTNMVEGRGSAKVQPRPVESESLKDIIVLHGEPLVLNPDSNGKRLRSRSNVTKVVLLAQDQKDSNGATVPHGRIDESELIINYGGLRRNYRAEFLSAIAAARHRVGAAAGHNALGTTVSFPSP